MTVTSLFTDMAGNTPFLTQKLPEYPGQARMVGLAHIGHPSGQRQHSFSVYFLLFLPCLFLFHCESFKNTALPTPLILELADHRAAWPTLPCGLPAQLPLPAALDVCGDSPALSCLMVDKDPEKCSLIRKILEQHLHFLSFVFQALPTALAL